MTATLMMLLLSGMLLLASLGGLWLLRQAAQALPKLGALAPFTGHTCSPSLPLLRNATQEPSDEKESPL